MKSTGKRLTLNRRADLVRDGSLLRCGDGKANGGGESLVVRPEKIEIGASHASGLNNLQGVVYSITYLGPLTEICVRLPGGEKLMAHRQNRRLGEVEQLRPGEPATVAWAPDASFVL